MTIDGQTTMSLQDYLALELRDVLGEIQVQDGLPALSSLRVTENGYRQVGRMVGELARDLAIPVLLGGAGGYQPLTWTPRLWVTVVTEVLDSAKLQRV